MSSNSLLIPSAYRQALHLVLDRRPDFENPSVALDRLINLGIYTFNDPLQEEKVSKALFEAIDERTAAVNLLPRTVDAIERNRGSDTFDDFGFMALTIGFLRILTIVPRLVPKKPEPQAAQRQFAPLPVRSSSQDPNEIKKLLHSYRCSSCGEMFSVTHERHQEIRADKDAALAASGQPFVLRCDSGCARVQTAATR